MKGAAMGIGRHAWPFYAAFAATPALAAEPSVTSDSVPALAPASPASAVSGQAASQPAAKAEDKTSASLSVEASIFYDSNVLDGRWIPGVSPDPNAPQPEPNEKKDEIGRSAGASGSLRVPLQAGLRLDVDAGVYLLDFDGSEDDEATIQLAAGLSFAVDEKTRLLVQATGSDRWYGHELSSAARGVRAQISRDLGAREKIVLTVDTSWLSSEYGEALSGRELAGSLAYQRGLGSSAYLMLGAYARGDWLRSDTYSSWDAGGYASVMTYLGPRFLGGATLGLGHIQLGPGSAFEIAPRRSDWNMFGSIYLTTRKPVLLGVSPYIDYAFGRRWSVIPALSTDHSRLRLSLRRQF
jgi:hypothetical protein